MPSATLPLTQSHFEQLLCPFDEMCREQNFMAFTQAGQRERTAAHRTDRARRKFHSADTLQEHWFPT